MESAQQLLTIEDVEKTIEDTKIILRKLENMRNFMMNGVDVGVIAISPEKEKEFNDLLNYTYSGKEKIKSRSRKQQIAMERHLVWWIAKHELKINTETIAILLGGRERTTMYNSIGQAEMMIKYPNMAPDSCSKLLDRINKFKEKNRVR